MISSPQIDEKDLSFSLVRKLYHDALSLLPPPIATTVHFAKCVHYLPNLIRPRTFNEKVQKRKLHPNSIMYAPFSDKELVKTYVSAVVGERYVTRSLWSGDRLPRLPTWEATHVVIKATHGSSLNIFVNLSDDVDWELLRTNANNWLQTKWPAHLHEPWYDHIRPGLLVEPNLSADGLPPVDYKMFVFSGIVRLIQVDTDRFGTHKRTFFDRNWRVQPFRLKFPVDRRLTERPLHLDEMIEVAEELASGFDFVRVDLYDLESGPRFGEMTFAPGSGFETFSPRKFDEQIGSLWDLSDTISIPCWPLSDHAKR